MIKYSDDFDTLDAETVKPLEGNISPEAINAQVNAVLSDVGVPPEIDGPTDCVVNLPSGQSALVRELTGDDEEALAKIDRNTHTTKFMATLLQRGVEELNDEPVTAKDLKNLLLGDREALILGIRIATFGKKIELYDLICPGENCGVLLDIDIDVSTIPIEPIVEDRFKVNLWKGGIVEVRLPNGFDQEEVFNRDKTSAEQNTILLSRCIQGYSLTDVKKLGVKDRRNILTAIVEHTGGPQYGKVTFTHEDCGTEVPVVITAGHLFQDL